MRFVVEQNIEEQDDPGASGEEKEDDGEAGIAPDAKARFHPHEERGADDESGNDEADDDAIRDFLKANDERLFIDGID